MPSPKILIVGAGPVGLTTALCLHRSGVPPQDILVVDQKLPHDPSRAWPKAISMSASTLEVFRILGIAERFLKFGRPLHIQHFGGGLQLLHLNYDVIGTKYPFNMSLNQRKTEEILVQRCEELGIKFSWGRRFISLSQTESAVSVRLQKTDTPDDTGDDVVETIESSWLIGCDSTHSAVRQAAGISFEGTATTRYSWIADGFCDADLPRMLTVRGDDGQSLVIATGDGPTGRRFIGNYPPAAVSDGERPHAPNESDVRERALKAFGTHYNFHDMTWSSVVGNAMRIAGSFRSGRVFIAGDSAHQIHPSGGMGMNTGILDAADLGWKLAAVVTGAIGPDQGIVERVLDSYTTERLGSGKAVIGILRAQMPVLFETTEDEKAISAFITEALAEPNLSKRWAQRMTGFGDPVEPYQLAFGRRAVDSLVGTRVTHIADVDNPALVEATLQGKFILAAVGESSSESNEYEKFKGLANADKYKGRVCVLKAPLTTMAEKWNKANAVLIRPDLRVAWVARDDMDIDVSQAELANTLQWWLG
ncbi:FAD binding domain-containing protein [Diaporthe helianthi]|uniref:FAD binding domain-containing protein n=1 Tax=Diaporthe helianthi TaxID=158607 RepID=A0A2P5HHR9_DIAHE|nr:FAD binding domain-containing protein [Diaporthe helianthi]